MFVNGEERAPGVAEDIGRTRASLIQTLTVGIGISPIQSSQVHGRVADYNRRFGITPTPEHMMSISPEGGLLFPV